MDKSLKARENTITQRPRGATSTAQNTDSPSAGAADSLGKKPTLRTVAEATGFAVTTVSRALSGDPKIAKSTRQTVAAAAAQIGYVPDRAAQRLRTGRTNVIGLVLDPHTEILGFSGSMLTGLARAMAGTRYHISITQHGIDDDPMAPIRHILRNRLADGVVFARTKADDPRVALLLEHGFPFVTHGRTVSNGAHPYLDFDNDAFARLAVGRLAAKGRRRIALIPPSPAYTFWRHMTAGFEAAVAEAGVTPILPPGPVHLHTDPHVLHRWFVEAFARDDAPDGVICPGEIAAVAVLAAVTDSGLTLGADVDLISKRTTPVFDLYRPRIETINEDIEASGFRLGQLLLRSIAGEPAEALQDIQAPEASF